MQMDDIDRISTPLAHHALEQKLERASARFVCKSISGRFSLFVLGLQDRRSRARASRIRWNSSSESELARLPR